MTPASVIRLMPLNKNEITDFVDKAVNQIVNGDMDIIETAIYLKAMEEVVKGIRDNKKVKESIMFELAETGKLSTDNANISIVETSRYDYSGDAKWNGFEKEIGVISRHKKSREKLLQILESDVADPDTGEMICPAVKTIQKSVRVALK